MYSADDLFLLGYEVCEAAMSRAYNKMGTQEMYNKILARKSDENRLLSRWGKRWQDNIFRSILRKWLEEGRLR
jgi:hypothetical protein